MTGWFQNNIALVTGVAALVAFLASDVGRPFAAGRGTAQCW